MTRTLEVLMDTIITSKRCSTCRQEKPLAEFEIDKRRMKDGRGSRCHACCVLRRKDWRKNNREKARDQARKHQKTYNTNHPGRRLKHKYNLTLEEYEQLMEKHNRRCAICGKEDRGIRLCIDHDHKTGEIRGLLCRKCNLGLGYFMDNAEALTNAIKYLQS
jgi:hypothetical protein